MSTVTPSKAAAAALSEFTLNTPVKSAQPDLLSKLKAAAAAEAGVKETAPAGKDKVVIQENVQEEATAEEDEYSLRQRYVGDIHCTEAEEPLLKETTSRFVLFPIKFREVSFGRGCSTRPGP